MKRFRSSTLKSAVTGPLAGGKSARPWTGSATRSISILGPEVQALEEETAKFLPARRSRSGVSSGTDAPARGAHGRRTVGPGDEVPPPRAYSFLRDGGGRCPRLGATARLRGHRGPTRSTSTCARSRRASRRRRKPSCPSTCTGAAPTWERAAGGRDGGGNIVPDRRRGPGRSALRTAEGPPGGAASARWAASSFFFFRPRNLGGFRPTAACVTNERRGNLAESLRVLRVHGSKPKYYHKVVGGNFSGWNALPGRRCCGLKLKAPAGPGRPGGGARTRTATRKLFCRGRGWTGKVTPAVRRPGPHLQPVRHPGADSGTGWQAFLTERQDRHGKSTIRSRFHLPGVASRGLGQKGRGSLPVSEEMGGRRRFALPDLSGAYRGAANGRVVDAIAAFPTAPRTRPSSQAARQPIYYPAMTDSRLWRGCCSQPAFLAPPLLRAMGGRHLLHRRGPLPS